MFHAKDKLSIALILFKYFLHKSIENGLDINYSLQLWNSNEIKNDIKMADLTKKPYQKTQFSNVHQMVISMRQRN